MSAAIPASPPAQTPGRTEYLDATVRDVMTPGVVSVVEDASVTQVRRAMAAHAVHAVLVVGRRTGTPLGWVTARGLLAWVEADASLVRARDAITERAQTIEPSATLREAITQLAQPGTTHLLVSHAPDLLPEGVLSDLDLVRLA